MLASYKVDATRDSEPEQSFKLLRFEGENHIFALALNRTSS